MQHAYRWDKLWNDPVGTDTEETRMQNQGQMDGEALTLKQQQKIQMQQLMWRVKNDELRLGHVESEVCKYITSCKTHDRHRGKEHKGIWTAVAHRSAFLCQLRLEL